MKLVYPSQSPVEIHAEVDLRLEGAFLSVQFSVRSTRALHVNSELPKISSQWGLWDWDVVELFLSCDGSPSGTPYYEFQVSPLGQFLELEIIEPRKRINRDFKSGFEYSAQISSPGNWDAQLILPLEKLGWDGNAANIRGNAFAILGPADSRTYWSLFLGPQTKPDFHLPEEFRVLL